MSLLEKLQEYNSKKVILILIDDTKVTGTINVIENNKIEILPEHYKERYMQEKMSTSKDVEKLKSFYNYYTLADIKDIKETK